MMAALGFRAELRGPCHHVRNDAQVGGQKLRGGLCVELVGKSEEVDGVGVVARRESGGVVEKGKRRWRGGSVVCVCVCMGEGGGDVLEVAVVGRVLQLPCPHRQ